MKAKFLAKEDEGRNDDVGKEVSPKDQSWDQ